MRSDTMLLELGRRITQARGARRISCTELARQAGLSRRYVAMAEAGQANVSLLKLAALAAVLRIPLRDLCDLDVSHAPELRIALLGLRGAGKSSVAKCLAGRLEVPCFELDRLVEDQAGMSLASVFELHGEDGFRERQRVALESWLEHHGSGVLATGGSIVDDDAAYARLRSTCRTVWLRARAEEHWQRVVDQGDMRPMRNNPAAMDELRAILAAREPRYALADLVVATSGRDPTKVADEVASWVTSRTEGIR